LTSILLQLQRSTTESLVQALGILGDALPLPVVVASCDYAILLENWIAQVQALGIDRFLIVAMDDALSVRLQGRGFAVARSNFDGSAADFWLKRVFIWRHLLHLGVHIVQCDVDAIWLRDPTFEFFVPQEIDILCSQGTLHPGDIAAMWRFVLCTGLMSVRPTTAAIQFFDAFSARAEQILRTDDQAVMNRMLAERGLAWNRRGLSPIVAALEGHPFDTFGAIIDAEDRPTGCRIGLLPHSLFPRLPTAAPGAFVKHVLRPEEEGKRIAELQAVGCWLLQDDVAARIPH
jgi:hypothetical protein